IEDGELVRTDEQVGLRIELILPLLPRATQEAVLAEQQARLARERRIALPARLPLVGVEARNGDVGVAAAIVAECLETGVEAQRGFPRGVLTAHLLQEQLSCRARIRGGVLHHAAKVVRARRSETASALR